MEPGASKVYFSVSRLVAREILYTLPYVPSSETPLRDGLSVTSKSSTPTREGKALALPRAGARQRSG